MKPTIMERRRIEAEILKNVYEVLVETHGINVACSTLDSAVSRSAVEQGAKYRAELGRDPDLKDLAAILPDWAADNALVIDVLTSNATQLFFDVKRCRYAEMYRELGLSEIGHLLSCNRDGKFCVGYNPNITLDRSQTLMAGASHCDFRYQIKSGAEDKK